MPVKTARRLVRQERVILKTRILTWPLRIAVVGIRRVSRTRPVHPS
jgi:hypothetical protein